MNAITPIIPNTRVVIRGTTYATANITSVRKYAVPAKNGCAATLLAVSALGALGGFMAGALDSDSGRWSIFIFSMVLFVVGLIWFRSIRATYHVMLATAGGERPGLTSDDEALADRVTAAIADAIVHRG